MKRKKSKSEKVVQSVEIPVFLYDGKDWPGAQKDSVPVPEPQMDLVTGTFKHVDEYIDDETQPECLRKFLDRARQPAHGMLNKEPFPKLFATYTGKEWRGVSPGDRVRVVMASRLGDVGVTKNMAADHGGELRCPVGDLTDFSAEA